MDVHGCQNLETILFNDRMMVRKNPNCSCSETEDQPLHRAGPEVPLWTQDEVCEWVKQIGFDECIERFECRRVDGDLLLQMTDNNLRSSIGIKSELMLKRYVVPHDARHFMFITITICSSKHIVDTTRWVKKKYN